MLFVTEKRPDLRVYSPAKGVDVQFREGRYETDDPAEIAVLERNRYVTSAATFRASGIVPELGAVSGPFDVDVVPVDADPIDEDEDGDDADRSSADA